MTEENTNIFAAMQTGSPFSTYKKTILGRVYVETIDPFSGKPVGVMLYGDPKKGDESCFIDMWSERDDVFFKRRNKVHFERGVVVPFTRKEHQEVAPTIEQFTDEQLKEIVNSKFLSLQSKLNKTESVATIFRMLNIARELEKSEAIIRAIEARLAEIQGLPVSE